MRNLSLLSVLVFITLLFLSGCATSSMDLHSTREEAISYGLEQESSESIGDANLLSVEGYKGETLVFFELNRALGVASISEEKNGLK
ncbi:hypothetical protein [Desertibacillus haloalkaliphilus]|uniref:hypothetical protein n=1 Tax=Desertibacillus haloalkaliphilus TaxID=1328930 RepID=UPI001C27CD5F|nr:hypothetical protein [Desertibacillus haloalkaliphilus]MBU8907522.1 hypothetical protein [Desertibacillus haloalkaliphilus]